MLWKKATNSLLKEDDPGGVSLLKIMLNQLTNSGFSLINSKTTA
jgi:hypothetical protein